MQSKPIDVDRTPNKRQFGFWHWFFGTLIVLLAFVLVMVTIMRSNQPPQAMLDAQKTRIHEFLKAYDGTALRSQFPTTESAIDRLVDEAFQPVYENIPRFTDRHYSVTGEYTELAYGAIGELENKINSTLFGGLEQRLVKAGSATRSVFVEEFTNTAKKWLQSSKADISKQQWPAFDAALDMVLADTKSRFQLQETTVRGAASIAGGAVTVKAISSTMAKKMLATTSLKATGKVAAKSAATAAGAAAGAGAGSVVPGIGTAIGGVLAGIVSWFTVDKVFVEMSEYLNRDDFEAKIHALVDENKSLIKAEMRKMIQHDIENVRGKTPLELIREQ